MAKRNEGLAKKVGAPKGSGLKRTPEIVEIILQRLSAGESLNAICHGEDPVGVAESTVRDWVVDDPEFGARYTRARDVGLDCRADRVIEEARQAKDAGLGRLKFDADRWYLSKMAPKRFGDKIEHEHKGGVTVTTGKHDADI